MSMEKCYTFFSIVREITSTGQERQKIIELELEYNEWDIYTYLYTSNELPTRKLF